MAVTTITDLSIIGGVLLIALLCAAVWLARKDRVTRVKLGIFFERERERDYEAFPPETPSEGDTKIMGPWPGEKKEEE